MEVAAHAVPPTPGDRKEPPPVPAVAAGPAHPTDVPAAAPGEDWVPPPPAMLEQPVVDEVCPGDATPSGSPAAPPFTDVAACAAAPPPPPATASRVPVLSPGVRKTRASDPPVQPPELAEDMPA